MYTKWLKKEWKWIDKMMEGAQCAESVYKDAMSGIRSDMQWWMQFNTTEGNMWWNEGKLDLSSRVEKIH